MFNVNLLILSKQINDISQTVQDHLKLNSWLADGIRGIGDWLYTLLSFLVNGLDAVFKELVNVDLSKVINLGSLKVSLNDLTWYLLLLTILGVCIMKIFSAGHDFTFLRNIFIIIIAITVFSEFTSYMNDVKSSGIKIIDNGLGRQENVSMSEKVFHDNAYDMLASVKNNKITKLSTNIKSSVIDVNEQISKDDLQGKYVPTTDGGTEVKNLKDGFNGILDERYYRYDINFLSINLTLVVMLIFYLIGGFKVIYIMWDLFFVNLLGTVVIATGVNNIKKVGSVFGYVAKTIATFLITYGGMMAFSNVSSSLFNNMELSWIAKIGILFGFGFVVILGSGFVTKHLGMDDGSGFLLKSMFAGRALSRMGTGAFKKTFSAAKKGSDLINKVGNAGVNKASNIGSNLIEKSENRKMKENMNAFYNQGRDNFQKPKLTDSIYGNKQLENKDVQVPADNERMINDNNGYTYKEKVDPSENTDSYNKKDIYGTDNPKEKEINSFDVNSKTPYNNQSPIDNKTSIADVTPKQPYKKDTSTTSNAKNYSNYKKDLAKNNKSVVNDSNNKFPIGNIKSKQPYKKVKSTIPSNVKSYADYKRDYSKGDKSVVYDNKKQYRYGEVKQLPSWFYNQDNVDVGVDDFDEGELMRNLEELRKQSDEYAVSVQKEQDNFNEEELAEDLKALQDMMKDFNRK